MSVKTTINLTKKQAIETITRKKLEPIKQEIEYTLNHLTNKELEELLDTKYYDSEFENYSIIEENKGDE